MMKILLVGQGIAGTMLAWSLRRRGALVHLADLGLAGASSLAAAGIIHPVTGKRFVKSWRFDEFFPLAKKTYLSLEQELGVPIWEERPTLRLLGTPEEANDWSVRCAQEAYTKHLGEVGHAGAWDPFLKPGFRFGLIRQSARVKFPSLLARFRQMCQQAGILMEKTIEYQETETLLREYDRIVYCEGWRAEANPYFHGVPFRVSKGEALVIRFRQQMDSMTSSQAIHNSPSEMLKKTVLLAPLGDGTFWAGSTYRWDFADAGPSAEGKEYILGHLREMFAVPFEVVGHVAGIRPTMLDRRPVFGQSTINPKVFIFNGLGTKGALLAPYFAEQLAEAIFKQG